MNFHRRLGAYNHRGIYNGRCKGQDNHAVTAVGWGFTKVGKAKKKLYYWIIRNSYGSRWNDSGHIRIKINGKCRINFGAYADVYA